MELLGRLRLGRSAFRLGLPAGRWRGELHRIEALAEFRSCARHIDQIDNSDAEPNSNAEESFHGGVSSAALRLLVVPPRQPARFRCFGLSEAPKPPCPADVPRHGLAEAVGIHAATVPIRRQQTKPTSVGVIFVDGVADVGVASV